MSKDPEYVRRTAREHYSGNSQTEKASEHQIFDSTTRDTYNAELERLRKNNGQS